MAEEKICSGGHVYLEEKCDRCGAVDPRLTKTAEETAPVESKSVSRRKAASKPAPKAKAKKVVKATGKIVKRKK